MIFTNAESFQKKNISVCFALIWHTIDIPKGHNFNILIYFFRNFLLFFRPMMMQNINIRFTGLQFILFFRNPFSDPFLSFEFKKTLSSSLLSLACRPLLSLKLCQKHNIGFFQITFFSFSIFCWNKKNQYQRKIFCKTAFFVFTAHSKLYAQREPISLFSLQIFTCDLSG
jgi:hypothetical protein